MLANNYDVEQKPFWTNSCEWVNDSGEYEPDDENDELNKNLLKIIKNAAKIINKAKTIADFDDLLTIIPKMVLKLEEILTQKYKMIAKLEESLEEYIELKDDRQKLEYDYQKLEGEIYDLEYDIKLLKKQICLAESAIASPIDEPGDNNDEGAIAKQTPEEFDFEAEIYNQKQSFNSWQITESIYIWE